MKKSTYITRCALFCALGALLPQAFHIFGEAAGKTLLPMHIPAMLAGIFAGPLAGLITGFVSPILSNLITGGTMPILLKVPFMMLEIGAYGFFCGFMYKNLSKTKVPEYAGTVISVITAQIAGRLVNAAATLIAVYALGIVHPALKTAALWGSVVSGVPGIIIQLVIIPPLAVILKKAAEISKEKSN